MRISPSAVLGSLCVFALSSVAGAQTATVPLKTWSETASIGYSLTSGNRDTSTLNIGYEVIYDPKQRNLLKTDGLYLRGKSEGFLTADRLVLNGRDEFRFDPRAFVFTQIQYVQDRFKNIDYLIAPTAGLGWRAVDSRRTKLSIDTGLGGVWEKNPDAKVVSSGAFSYAEKFSYALSPTTTITQVVSALHKIEDFGDALFILNAGVAASLTTRTQIKVELLDTYKRRIPSLGVIKNDVAVVIAFVYKN